MPNVFSQLQKPINAGLGYTVCQPPCEIALLNYYISAWAPIKLWEHGGGWKQSLLIG